MEQRFAIGSAGLQPCTIAIRRHHGGELWAQARRDYLAGYTASAVSKHYGMSVDAIRKRASKQKWGKANHMVQEPPPPLHLFPCRAQAIKESARA